MMPKIMMIMRRMPPLCRGCLDHCWPMRQGWSQTIGPSAPETTIIIIGINIVDMIVIHGDMTVFQAIIDLPIIQWTQSPKVGSPVPNAQVPVECCNLSECRELSRQLLAPGSPLTPAGRQPDLRFLVRMGEIKLNHWLFTDASWVYRPNLLYLIQVPVTLPHPEGGALTPPWG